MTTPNERSFICLDGKWRTPAQLMRLAWWKGLHPEIRRRFLALCIYAQTLGHPALGPQGGLRTAAQQQAARDKNGYSPLPGGSYHEGCDVAAIAAVGHLPAVPAGSYALALDAVWNADLDAMYTYAAAFGLVNLHDYKNDRPHFQAIEVARARSRTRTTPYVLKRWKLNPAYDIDAPAAQTPAEPPKPAPPAPAPFPAALGPWGPIWAQENKPEIVLRPKRTRGDLVKYLQGVLDVAGTRRIGGAGIRPGALDGIYGPDTENAVKNFQKAFGLYVDGKVGPRTWATIDTLALDLVGAAA